METSHDLIQIAVVTVVALLCGLGLTRLKQPPIVGYILAGVLLGPSALSLVGDRTAIALLADLGLLSLLFLLGMELSLRSFRVVYRVVLLGTGLQIAGSLLAAAAVAALFDWTIERAVLLGFIFALSSTAVAIKILDDVGELRTRTGRVAVGVLIAQDLSFIPMLLVIRGLAAEDGFDLTVLPLIAAAVGLLIGLVWLLSRRQRLRLPFADRIETSPDIAPLAALTLCFAAATVSAWIGLSAAYGAFLAGLVIGNSTSRATMIEATQPIQSVLMVVFFVSIGLLIDLRFLIDHLGSVLLLLLVVALVKTAINIAALSLAGEPWERAFLSGVVLGQMGEFSFVLATVGVGMGVVDSAFRDLAITVIALSFVISPLWLYVARHFNAYATDGLHNLRTELRLMSRNEMSTLDALLSCQPQDLPRLLLVLLRRGGRTLRDLPQDIAEHTGLIQRTEERREETPEGREGEPREPGPGTRTRPAE